MSQHTGFDGERERGDSPDISTLPDGAPDHLFELAYAKLHSIARRLLAGEREGHTLQPTALVNEAYLKLRGQDGLQGMPPGEFRARAAGAMRLILIDSARRHRAAKRPRHRVTVAVEDIPASQPTVFHLDQMLALHEALDRLATQKPNGARHARLIEYVWFGGLSFGEAADRLHLSRRQAHRDWAWARVWLRSELAV